MTSLVAVSTAVGAMPAQVYALVADLGRMPEWSPEAAAMTWLDGATEPAPGARFRGSNSRGRFFRWRTVSEVLMAEPGRALTWRTTYLGMRVAVWRYAFEDDGAGGTEVIETWEDERGVAMKVVGFVGTGVADRAAHNAATMRTTLERIKATAEAEARGSGQKAT